MQYRVRLYVGGLTGLALLVSAWVYLAQPVTSWDFVKAALLFAILAAACEMAAYKKASRNESGSIAFLPILAGVIVSPSWPILLTVAGATCLVQIANRRVFIKGVFNVAQVTVWVGLGVLLYRAMGGEPLLTPDASVHIPAFVTILVVFAVINSVAVAAAISLSEGRDFSQLWWESARVTLLYDIFALPFVYGLALCYVAFGWLGPVVALLPLLGFRHANKVNWQLQQTNQELLQLMVAAIEARDPYTSGHSRRVARNARLIAEAIGLRSKEVERVAVAALLHDVGKIHEVFAPILSKPGRLTADENAVMQTHPIKSEELVRTVSQLGDVVQPIRNHHENWDGTGYPDGLVGEAIPLASRIIMFADTIDAMTTDRPYRAALSEAQVRAEFVSLSGRQFDPHICEKLLNSPIYLRLFDNDVPLTPVIAVQERRKTPAPSSLLAS